MTGYDIIAEFIAGWSGAGENHDAPSLFVSTILMATTEVVSEN